MKKQALQLFLTVIILVLGGVTAWYFLASKLTSTPKDQQERQWTVKVGHVLTGDFSPTLTLYGVIEAPDKATISSALAADVSQLLTKEGAHVNKGAILVLLDQQDAQLTLKQRQTELNLVEAKIKALEVSHQSEQVALTHEQKVLALEKKSLARLEKLFKSNHISKETLDKAEQNFAKTNLSLVLRKKTINNFKPQYNQLLAQQEAAKTLWQKALLDLARSTIKSPFSGIVDKVFIAKGDRVSRGSPLLSIKPFAKEEIRVQAPPRIADKFVRALKQHQPITGSINVHGKNISVILDRLTPSIDPGKIGTEALFISNEKNHLLTEGTVVRVVVTLQSKANIYAAPIQALYGNNRLYQVSKGRLSPVKIQRIGHKYNKKGEQMMLFKSKSLNKQLPILVSQLPNAYPGLKVRAPVNAKTTPKGAKN